MSNDKDVNTLTTPNGITFYYTGPPLETGMLPGVFYFALSGKESLRLDPFNQPVVALKNSSIRVYSLDLPNHGSGIPSKEIMKIWSQRLHQGQNFVNDFILGVIQVVDYLVSQKYLDSQSLGVAGLSRGGLFAMHLAVADHRFRFLLGFAPVTKITVLTEFQVLKHDPFVETLDSDKIIEHLAHIQAKFYIGNRDVCVQTSACVDFVLSLSNFLYQKGQRSPPVELVISPSIGHLGHGTSPENFQNGAKWMKHKLESNT
jgi:esterase FrsA